MNRFVVAALAAVAASGGDILMLYVVNVQRPELGLVPSGTWMLPVGYYLGVLAIPLYAVGYAALAKTVASTAPRASAVVFTSGLIMGILGAVLHGATGVAIEAQLRAGARFPNPVEGLLAFGTYVLPLWAAVGLFGLLASGAYVYVVACDKSPLPRWTATINPALLVMVMAIASSGSPLLDGFLAPAAPNIAHALFFGFLATRHLYDRGAGWR